MWSERESKQIGRGLILGLAGLLWAVPAWSSQSSSTQQASNTTSPATRDPQPASSSRATTEPNTKVSGNYIIGRDDVLNIHVWHQPDVSGTVTVRPDGMISLPLVGELEAVGITPEQLQSRIVTKLKAFVQQPEVVVVVQQVNSRKFNILGQVQKPGSYPLTGKTHVLDAIAMAGGFQDFAGVTKMYVLRTDASGDQQKIKFNYKKVIHGEDPSQNIELKPGDTVVVP